MPEANGRERCAAVRLRRTFTVGRIHENPQLDPVQTRAVTECLGRDSTSQFACFVRVMEEGTKKAQPEAVPTSAQAETS